MQKPLFLHDVSIRSDIRIREQGHCSLSKFERTNQPRREAGYLTARSHRMGSDGTRCRTMNAHCAFMHLQAASSRFFNSQLRSARCLGSLSVVYRPAQPVFPTSNNSSRRISWQLHRLHNLLYECTCEDDGVTESARYQRPSCWTEKYSRSRG